MSENPVMYTDPVFTVQAKTIFDEGINSVEHFREIYMNDNKEGKMPARRGLPGNLFCRFTHSGTSARR
jgi:hypothetical protein